MQWDYGANSCSKRYSLGNSRRFRFGWFSRVNRSWLQKWLAAMPERAGGRFGLCNASPKGLSMKIHHITTTTNDTLHANKAGHTWIVEKTGSIVTPSTGIDASTGAADRTIIVKGEVYGLNFGIEFGLQDGSGGGKIAIQQGGLVNSDDTAILSRGDDQIITNNGMINGNNGITSLGKRAIITNNAAIETSNGGIDVEMGSATIYNSGTIDAEAGIYSTGFNHNKVVLFNSGEITTEKTSVQIYSDGNHQIYNTGLIGGGVALGDGNSVVENTGAGKIAGYIDLGGGNDRLFNTGKIVGDIELGDGNDLIDLRGGKANGEIHGELGNDTYIVDRQSFNLIEDGSSGIDTIKTTVSFSLSAGSFGEMEKLVAVGMNNISLIGDDLANRLLGNAGKNHLDGTSGDDVLVGGKGADVFIFGTNHQSDTVVDFENGIDRFDVSDWSGIANPHDIKQHMSVDGDDLVISMGSDELHIKHTAKSEIDASDFLFAA
jgi:hypothetical protein